MITKFKIYEGLGNFTKPEKGSNDFDFEWSSWAFNTLESEFGESFSGDNADWGGNTIWQINGSTWEGYFIYLSDDDEYIYMNRSYNEKTEENVDTDFITATAENDNLEELIEMVKKQVKIKEFNL